MYKRNHQIYKSVFQSLQSMFRIRKSQDAAGLTSSFNRHGFVRVLQIDTTELFLFTSLSLSSLLFNKTSYTIHTGRILKNPSMKASQVDRQQRPWLDHPSCSTSQIPLAMLVSRAKTGWIPTHINLSLPGARSVVRVDLFFLI